MPGKLSHLLCPQFTTHLQAITITAFSVSPDIPLQCDWMSKAKTKPYKLQSFCLMEDTLPKKADEIFCPYCPQFSASLFVCLHWGYFIFQLVCATARSFLPAQQPREPPQVIRAVLHSFWKPKPGCNATLSSPASSGFVQQSIPLQRSTWMGGGDNKADMGKKNPKLQSHA